MYNNHFGFIERPFQLVPNPDYLFLSSSHEEALAHLTYSISQGDGFVEITGEVGTGKTTLCRVLLESLDADTEAAFIFNPMLDSIQLLKAINDEFGISSEANNTKELIDTLNFFLLRKKSQGRKVVLLIDEAQNLSLEVLEQIRLLSNLETTTSKLLQIILVGQPELCEKLDSYQLRQLGQRITLSYHLAPLTYQETKSYIQHRLKVAAKKNSVEFTRSAFKLIYRYSGGIPRLINIVCDRALLTAYGLNQKNVSGVTVSSAIKELSSRGDVKRESESIITDRMPVYLLMVLMLTIFTALVFYFLRQTSTEYPLIATIPTPHKESKIEPETVLEQKTKTVKPKSTEPKIVEPKSAEPKIVPPPAISVKISPQTINTEPETKPVDETLLEADPSSQPIPIQLKDYITSINLAASAPKTLAAMLEIWGEKTSDKPYKPQPINNVQQFFRDGLQQFGLTLHPFRQNMRQIENINIPAILELVIPETGATAYIALKSVTAGKYTLYAAPDIIIETELSELQQYFFNRAFLVWKNYYDIEGTIPREINQKSIIALKKLLVEMGFAEISMTHEYDAATRKTIENIQRKNGLTADGVVGPLTKIILYREHTSLSFPRLFLPDNTTI